MSNESVVSPRILGNKSHEEPVRVKITSYSSFGCCEALGSHAFGRDLTERGIIRGFRWVWSCFLTAFSFLSLQHLFSAFCFCITSSPSSVPFPHFLLPLESFFPAMVAQRRKRSMVDQPWKVNRSEFKGNCGVGEYGESFYLSPYLKR